MGCNQPRMEKSNDILLTRLAVTSIHTIESKNVLKLLKNVDIDNTSEKFVYLHVMVKNTNRNAKIVKYMIKDKCTSTRVVDFEHQIALNAHVLFLVNPVSGKRKGMSKMKKLKPILDLLKINYTIIITATQNHIQDIEFTKYSKIVFLSGDGLIYDFCQLAIKKNLMSIPVAIIKSGTGNALATSVDCLDSHVALLTALYGDTKDMTLTKYEFIDQCSYSFLGFYWGLIADIDLGSERFRCVGPLRTEIAAVYFMLKHKKYKGLLKYKTEDNDYESVEVDLSCFLAMTLPFLDEEHFGCPYARLSDKYIHIIHKDLKLGDGLTLLLNGRDLDKFLGMNWNYIKTTEYELEPLGSNSLFDLDGEFVPYIKFKASVSDLSMTVMVPHWLDEDKTTSTTSHVNIESE